MLFSAAAYLVLLALLAPNSIMVVAQSPFDVEYPCTTDTTQWFDFASLQCLPCDSTLFREVNDEGNSCRCMEGYTQDAWGTTSAVDSDDFTCTQCATGSGSSRDRSTCITCGTGTTFDASILDCVCDNPGEILVENDAAGNFLATKTCVACPSGATSDRYTCIECPHASQTYVSGSCVCDGVTYTGSGDSCILIAHAGVKDIDVSKVLYRDVRSSDTGSVRELEVASSLFVANYELALVNCQMFHDKQACQMLANICVLEKYNTAREPCRKFNTLEASAGFTTLSRTDYGDWKDDLPWMNVEEPNTFLSNSRLKTEYSLGFREQTEEHSTVSNMRYLLAKYAFNGTFLGLEELTDQLQLCSGDPAKTDDFLRFGTTYVNECELHLKRIIEADETVFYDMYVMDEGGLLYPVLVKVTNTDDSTYHRRFFMYDNISSKDITSTDCTTGCKMVAWARSIELKTRMISGSDNRINPPYLTITYEEREVERVSLVDSTRQSVSTVEFVQEYTKDLSTLWDAALALLVIALFWTAIKWYHRMFVWQRANSLQAVDLSFLVRMLVFAVGAMADTFFWLVFILSMYCLIFFKMQETAFFLLPERNSEEVDLLITFIVIAFVGKLLDILYMVWRQTNIDIFFIDWEKPRGTETEMNTSPDIRDDQDEKDDTIETPMPVSVWRRLFAANKYQHLQTHRLLNVALSLFFIGFFLQGLGYDYMATSQPSLSTLEPDAAPINPILRFAVTSFFWLLVCYTQLIFRHLIYGRYFDDKASEFVDLLSMMNVSCFILDQRYHGFYIHGKTVHAHADASLEEMRIQVASERKNWTKKRGLTDGGKDTFTMYVSRQFRARYDRIFSSILARELTRRSLESRRAGGRGEGRDVTSSQTNIRNKTSLPMDDPLVAASHALNEFLKSFIEKNDTAHYPWEERYLRRTEVCCGIPPNRQHDSIQSDFYYDDPMIDSFAFKRVLLMGIEHDFVIFLALFYACMDLLFSNTYVSIICTYVINRLLMFMRSHWGKINLSLKTLVDEQFLR